jgi:ABC-type transport system involved in cytochrome c biogenesis permease subunit
MDAILFKTALSVYFISALLYGASLLGKRVFLARLAAGFMFAALVVHTSSFALLRFFEGEMPAIGIHVALSLFAWVMAATYLALQLKTKTRVLGAFVSPVICLFMVVASIGLGGAVIAPPMLRGSLVTVHVILSVAGEALFAVASCAGLMYLIQDGLIRRKRSGGLSRLLPPLGDLDRINHICLLWGVPLLTLGGLAGSLWARIVWGSHWQWDPKQVWTLLVWGSYAFLLHQRLAIGWRGRTSARWSLALFVILLVLLIVGLPFFGTLHRFV